jgi:hypothetical protein
LLVVLAPLACATEDATAESVASGALFDPTSPAPYHAEAISFPATLAVRPFAGAVRPAALDDTDRVPAPIMAATFEDASAACNDWDAVGADAIRSVPPHSGDYACRVCATGEVPELALGRSAGRVDAGHYSLTAFVRTRPRREAPPQITATIEADTPNGMVTATSPLVLGDTYAEVRVPIDLPQGATAIRARIGAVASADECMLVDDVYLAHALAE